MSWGERSCSQEKAPRNEAGGCRIAEPYTCNVDCKYYTWDGKTRPDSGPDSEFAEKFKKQLENNDA